MNCPVNPDPHSEHLYLLGQLDMALNWFNWAEEDCFDSANDYLTYCRTRLKEFYMRQRRTGATGDSTQGQGCASGA